MSPPSSGSWLSPAVTRGSASVLTLPSTGLALAWEGGWWRDVARTGEQGQGGGMGAGWWDGTGQPYRGRTVEHRSTLEVGWSAKAMRWVARLEGSQGLGTALALPAACLGTWWGVDLSDACGDITLPFLGQRLPCISLPAIPWGSQGIP